MNISVKIDDGGTKAYIAGVEGRLKNMVPALKQIGEHMLLATEGRFAKEQSPQGVKWAPLKPSTLKRKKGPKILTESAMLRGTIRWQLMGANAVAIGTDRPYGRIHQIGGTITQGARSELFTRNRRKSGAFKKGTKEGQGFTFKKRKIKIPARPYLGISSADQAIISEIVMDNILAGGRAKGRRA
jgi:phage virion morphogenesis protein